MSKVELNFTEPLQAYRQLVSLLDSGVLLIGEQGDILCANDSVAKMLDYEISELENMRIFDIHAEMSVLKWRSHLKDSHHRHEDLSHESECEYISKKGHSIPVFQKLSQPLSLSSTEIVIVNIHNLLHRNRYRDFMEMPAFADTMGAWDWDLRTNEVMMAGLCLELLGQSHEVIQVYRNVELHENVKDYINEKQLEQLLANLRRIKSEGGSFVQQITYQAKAPIELEISAQVLRMNMMTVKVYGLVRMTSALDKPSMSIPEQYTGTKDYEELVDDYSPLMICVLNAEGKILHANRTFLETLKLERKRLLDLHVFDFIPIWEPEHMPAYWDIMKNDRRKSYNIEYKLSTGQKIKVEVIHQLLSHDDEPFMSCIYASKNAEELRSNWRLNMARNSLDNATEMILWFDEGLNIRYTNSSIVSELGYDSKKKLVGSPLSRICDTTQIRQLVAKKGRVKQTIYLDFIPSSGNPIPVEASIIQVHTDFDRKYYSLISRNIQHVIEREKQADLLTKKLEAENLVLRKGVEDEYNPNKIITVSPNYKKVLSKVARVASTDSTVLILGETGTGKELIARAIYTLSDRSDATFLKVNCSAFPRDLIESELFGHEKGSFTGAHAQRKGCFEIADGGTIFLDEVGEIPLDLQPKLLRVLQEGELSRVGSSQTFTVDVRIIAATNRDLEKLVAAGKFREDLFYRLNVFPIFNIPLRERREDIPELIRHFVKRNSKRIGKDVSLITQADLKLLQSYPFPGNIRELENLVQRAMILSDGDTLRIADAMTGRVVSYDAGDDFPSFEEIQRQHIIAALQKTGWRITGPSGAGRLLQMNDRTLMSKMRKLDIQRKDYIGE